MTMSINPSSSPPTNSTNIDRDTSGNAPALHTPFTLPAIIDSNHLHTEDVEKQTNREKQPPPKESAFRSLGLLDRFLALWIFLAMLIGILLGNFVSNVGPALQKGKFVGVSIPIGTCHPDTRSSWSSLTVSKPWDCL